MIDSKDLNFSFSGLKTSVLYKVKDLSEKEDLSEDTVNDIAFEFQNAAIDCLVKKSLKACLIEHSQSLAEQGAEHIEKAVTRLLATTEQIGSLNEQMAELAAAAEQQSHATNSITGLMSDITQSVDEVSNNSQRASETSLQVKEQVTELNQQMATFKTA